MQFLLFLPRVLSLSLSSCCSFSSSIPSWIYKNTYIYVYISIYTAYLLSYYHSSQYTYSLSTLFLFSSSCCSSFFHTSPRTAFYPCTHFPFTHFFITFIFLLFLLVYILLFSYFFATFSFWYNRKKGEGWVKETY